MRLDVAEWQGTAAEAYRSWTAQQQQAIDALGKAASAMATITEAAGLLIATVRVMVRDAIAALVSRLIVYAAEEAASLGFASGLVVEQVSTLCAAWAAKIARWLKDLLASLRRLIPIVRRLGELIEQLKKILSRLHPGRRSPKPGGPRKPPSKYDGLSRPDLVKDRGANVGRPGTGPKVREVKSVDELQDYFDALTKGGYKDITPPGFPGKMVELPDGTIVNWRTQSKTTGSIPTVDVNPGNGQNFKVHVNPTGW